MRSGAACSRATTQLSIRTGTTWRSVCGTQLTRTGGGRCARLQLPSSQAHHESALAHQWQVHARQIVIACLCAASACAQYFPLFHRNNLHRRVASSPAESGYKVYKDTGIRAADPVNALLKLLQWLRTNMQRQLRTLRPPSGGSRIKPFPGCLRTCGSATPRASRSCWIRGWLPRAGWGPGFQRLSRRQALCDVIDAGRGLGALHVLQSATV